ASQSRIGFIGAFPDTSWHFDMADLAVGKRRRHQDSSSWAVSWITPTEYSRRGSVGAFVQLLPDTPEVKGWWPGFSPRLVTGRFTELEPIEHNSLNDPGSGLTADSRDFSIGDLVPKQDTAEELRRNVT